MLDIILQILSVIGTILLILLVVLLVSVLLILFFPITYRVYGKKKAEELNAWVKANWLLGLIRIRFFYPQPGSLTIKLLWFILFDSAQDDENEENKGRDTNKTSNKTSNKATKSIDSKITVQPDASKDDAGNIEKASVKKENIALESKEPESYKDIESGNEDDSQAGEIASHGLIERILAKYEKIKYTIVKIYDKIKEILENISFYKALFEDKQTQKLLKHASFRLGRILKSIRPRKLKGDIIFGTNSPDTTGYVFGIYGMLSAWLGYYINVTPDFTQPILEGEIYASGYITVFQVLRHSLAVVFDKQLKLLVHRIKKHKI